MRANLKAARKAAGMTQQQVADKLGISGRYYRAIENGERIGEIPVWDKLEDLFRIGQRTLREVSPN